MGSVKQQLTEKVSAFLYDHQMIPRQGKKLRASYKDVEKIIKNIGKDKG